MAHTRDILTLRQLAGVIRLAVTQQTGEYWVTAEVAHFNLNRRSGHCYLELIEKEDEKVLAQLRGTIWAGTFGPISREFREKTGRDLGAGLKVLMRARPVFHEVYGLSLNITDIDPSYTLGDIALKRKETLLRLQKEGVAGLNKSIRMPLVPQKIAVISSATAAGYGDFIDMLTGSPYTYGITLYEAYVQGERAEQSIIAALGKCTRNAARHDIVVIIRGGGAQSDLQCFDSYTLAREVAVCPLPVLTGIGHERDETVADTVAHTRLITPTAVAEYIISRARDFEEALDDLSGKLARRVEGFIASEKNAIDAIASGLRSGASRALASHFHLLGSLTQRLGHSARQAVSLHKGAAEGIGVSIKHLSSVYLMKKWEALRTLDLKVGLLDPVQVLKRGYSITTRLGRAVTDASSLSADDIIETRLSRGSVRSVVKETSQEEGSEDGG